MKFNPQEKIMINKTIRIEEGLLRRIFEVAGARKLSFNKFIIQCVEYALDNLTENDTTKKI